MFDGKVVTLTNVRHIPMMRKNLISLGEVDTKGLHWRALDGILTVENESKVIMKANKQRNLYILKGSTILGEGHAAINSEEETTLWHARLGHMSEKGMTKLHKQNLLPSLRSCKLKFCEHCVFGKHTRRAFGTGVHSSKEILEYVHSDVWGPSPVASHSGNEFYVTFIDDYSRYVWIYFLPHKSDVFITFKKWKAQVETQTGKKVKYLRSDNGGEYDSREFRAYCENEGVTRHFTTVYTPQ
jgi:hypothetical protein